MRLLPVVPIVWLVVLFVPPAVFLVLQTVRARGAALRAPIRRSAVLLLLLAAALGPSLVHGGTTRERVSDVDVVIAMDTTTSSNAEDEGGGRTRLDLMKQDVRDLTSDYPGARFALITFDQSATLRVPLVNDANALLSYLDGLTVEVTAQSRGSSPYEADQLVASTLSDARRSFPDHARVLFYLGDGEVTSDLPGETSFSAARGLFDAGEVYGYGTEAGGPMRENAYTDYQGAFDGSSEGPPDPSAAPTQQPYVIDPSTGRPAISRIDERTLRDIADDLGVPYAHRQPGTAPPAPSVKAALGRAVEVPDRSVQARLYWVPVIPAFLLLAWDLVVGWRAFSETRRARPGV